MKIKLLSDTTINRIAAGEVIERPASVVKELVENSIDAGATQVDIILEQAGKNLIIIADNGFGMNAPELEIAVERHTTSKLDEDDLLDINTFGFRGEALPSIGAVSKMFITSRQKNSDKAYQICLIGGKDKQLKPAVHNEGTKIEVRDLFFATPARLKFLRTDKTEFAATLDIIKKIALAHPHIGFSVTHDGKDVLKLKNRTGSLQEALKQRIIDIIGADFAENAAELDLTREGIAIQGYTSLPTFNRATASDQFLFINNRPVKDKIINIALKTAYQDYLARDRYPVSALFLRIDPQTVDVNVHPAKSEVRFHDPNLVRGLLIRAIKDALSTVSHKVSSSYGATALGFFNIEPASKPDIVEEPQQEYKYRPLLNSNFSQGYETRPFVPAARQNDEEVWDSPSQEKAEIAKPIFDSPVDLPMGDAKAQLHSTYILAQTADGVIIVDQHAAHERLVYEKIKASIEKNGLIKQRLLIPEIVELPDEKRAHIIDEQKGRLTDLGLSIDKFGEKSIIVSEIPSLIGDVDVKRLICDLADHLLDLGENIGLTELIEHVTETYACHYSIRAGRELSKIEMNELLRQMENTPFSGQCNHGRPTYVELKLKDIEKLFGRR